MNTDTSTRRAFLQAATAVGTVASTSLSGCLYAMGLQQRETHRRRVIRRRRSVGDLLSFASQRARIRKKDATVVVHDQSEFLSAIATSDAVVWIPESVTINITKSGPHKIAPGVRIASNRNLGKGKGGVVKTDKYMYRTFIVPKKGARVTGIRLYGPRTTYIDPARNELSAYTACGVHFQDTTGIVDNCEIARWPGFGIGLGTNSTTTQGWIHHNQMYHFPADGLGYPIELFNGISLIEWNYFSRYRHVVAGYGWKTNGYEFRCNVVGPPIQAMKSRFACDMHRLGEQQNVPDDVITGGKYLNIHHNVFEITSDSAVSAQGRPVEYIRIMNNWTAASRGGNGAEGVFYVAYPDKARIKHNHFEATDTGRSWLKRVAARISLSNGVPSLSKWRGRYRARRLKDREKIT